MQFQPIEMMKVALPCVAFTAVMLGWVHLSRQTKVSRSPRNSLIMVGRLVVVFASAIGIFCVWFGVPANVFLVLSGVFLLLVRFANLDAVPGNNAFEVAVGLMILLPVYVLKQFVLGFPDRDEVFLTPPAETFVPPDFSHLNAALGIVVATLKPSGKVQIDNAVYSATTEDGKLLDTGTAIRVSGMRNAVLVVRSVERINES
ncbi:MAG: hypothetical protein JWM11_3169 [Planctomycetaceae bacterium]|nr:hypothetical protein [Planctomycetaceae bacterium]